MAPRSRLATYSEFNHTKHHLFYPMKSFTTQAISTSVAAKVSYCEEMAKMTEDFVRSVHSITQSQALWKKSAQ